MGGDTWQSFSADVAEGRSGVRAGVPVVHPREVLHVELAGLGKEITTPALHGKLRELWRLKQN